MSRKRNPKATCKTCPYWAGNPKIFVPGLCCINHPEQLALEVSGGLNTWTSTLPDAWCGEHPDFDLESS